MRNRTTAAIWVRGIAEMLAAEGLDVRALARGRGGGPWRPASGSTYRECGPGRSGSARIDRKDQPPAGACHRAVREACTRGRGAPGWAAAELRGPRLRDDVGRRPPWRL